MTFVLPYRAVVVGASAGGPPALTQVLAQLPSDYGLPVLVVQHVHPQQESAILIYPPGCCALQLKEADEKERIQPGFVYFAPPNYHLLVEDDYTLALSTDERVNYARPSVDVLFESAAHVFGRSLVGIILSGANRDGAAGLRAVKRRGGLAIVQDPATAEVSQMPEAALAATQVDHILSPQAIGALLAKPMLAADESKQEGGFCESHN